MKIIPGLKYGIHGELIPRCRSISAMLKFLNSEDTNMELPENITATDSCQRGPGGKPLHCVTPMVPYLTLAEWIERLNDGQEKEHPLTFG